VAETFSRLFAGSEPDETPHPDGGFRQKKDELVNLIDNFFIPMGGKESDLDNSTFKFTEDHLSPRFMVTTGDNWLTAEFPFSGEEPVCVRLAQGKPGVVTSLFRVNSEEGHPLFGKGLMMRMTLPVSYGREEGLQIAMALNLLEATQWVKCHLIGAWHVDEQSNLVFVSFYPIVSFQSWELVDLALSCGMRSKWAGEVLGEREEDQPPGTRKMLH
jgi:hypothetical protein